MTDQERLDRIDELERMIENLVAGLEEDQEQEVEELRYDD